MLAIVVLAIVAAQFTSAAALGAELGRANWAWALVALVLQGAFFLLYGGLYQAGFRAVGVSSEALRLVPILFASIFAKTAVPFTAAPAAAVFIDDASARGESGPRAAVGVVVVLVVDLLTALPFVVAGTVALVMRDRLVEFALAGTGLFVAFIGGVLIVLGLAARRPGWLEALLVAVAPWSTARPACSGAPTCCPRAGSVGPPSRWRGPPTRSPVTRATWRSPPAMACWSTSRTSRVSPRSSWPRPASRRGRARRRVRDEHRLLIIAIVPDGVGAGEGAMALVFVSRDDGTGGDPGNGCVPHPQCLAPGRDRVVVRAAAPPVRRRRASGEPAGEPG